MAEPDDTAERIRQRAYQLWKDAGCPMGRSDEFWEQASVEIGNEIMSERPRGKD
jgi:hypothetical protein